jgi:hypothetical protein
VKRARGVVPDEELAWLLEELSDKVMAARLRAERQAAGGACPRRSPRLLPAPFPAPLAAHAPADARAVRCACFAGMRASLALGLLLNGCVQVTTRRCTHAQLRSSGST